MVDMRDKNAQQGHGATAVFIAGGLVWIGRAVLELVFRPDYWNPRTVVDYSAVAGTSLSLILLAICVWLVHQKYLPHRQERIWLWRAGIGLACSGALVAGIANVGEDWIAIKLLSTFFVFGSLATSIGLILAGISAIGAVGVTRWTGWLLITCAIGWAIFDLGGGFLVGLALLLIGVRQNRLV